MVRAGCCRRPCAALWAHGVGTRFGCWGSAAMLILCTGGPAWFTPATVAHTLRLMRSTGSPALLTPVSLSHLLMAPPAPGVKYSVKAVRQGPQTLRLHLGSTHVDVVVRKLNDGGLLVQVRCVPIEGSASGQAAAAAWHAGWFSGVNARTRTEQGR